MMNNHEVDSGDVEKSRLKLGYIPLTDCAPLVVALEEGFFHAQGLEIELSCEASWASIRDKVAIGALDGAHMLAAMPIAATLGLGALHRPMVTAFSMNLNGNAVTVSNTLFARMYERDAAAAADPSRSASLLKTLVDADRAAGKAPMTFAVVYPYSTHNYQLRYWLASGGIDPDFDVQLVVVPPPKMVAHLEQGCIDGYCVGEPWNALAVERGAGQVLLTGYDIWNNGPEKVFGVTEHWAHTYPRTHRAVLRALLQATQWLDEPENRARAAQTLCREYLNVPLDVMRASMTGTLRYSRTEAPRANPDLPVFHRYAANFPWRSHAQWLLVQMIRWGHADQRCDSRAVARRVYWTELFRDVAQDVGAPYPTIDYKTEGAHSEPWSLSQASAAIVMGADRLLDGAVFDPAEPRTYLRSVTISRLRNAGEGVA